MPGKSGRSDDISFNPSGVAPEPAWVQHLLGENCFSDVVIVGMQWSDVQQTSLEFKELEKLPGLRYLMLVDARSDPDEVKRGALGSFADLVGKAFAFPRRQLIDDDGMKTIGRLASLKEFHISRIPIGDLALRHVKNLTNLEVLDLNGTMVSDQGLLHFAPLHELRKLDLTETKVTAEGVRGLQKALPDCEISGP